MEIKIKPNDTFFMPSLSYPFSYTNRVNEVRLRQRRKTIRMIKAKGLEVGLSAIMIIAFSTLLSLAFVKGLDKHIENQDRMLCESAKVSRNTEYLNKCQCFYNGGDIRCLQGK